MVAFIVAVAPATAAPAGPGPGNSPNAKSCQKNGSVTLVREDGTGFANGGACTGYAARGGTLFNANEVSCLNGGYANYVTSTGQSFSDQAACVSYVRGGGQLLPSVATLSLTFTPSSSPDFCVANVVGAGLMPGSDVSISTSVTAYALLGSVAPDGTFNGQSSTLPNSDFYLPWFPGWTRRGTL